MKEPNYVKDFSNFDNTVEEFGLVKFINQERSLSEEKADRANISSKHVSFGLKYLDDMVGGIQRNDFILLGGKSGQGKTELANCIAETNIKKEKNVFYLALEAEKHELVRRQKFRMLAKKYYETPGRKKHLNYIDWYNLRQESLVEYYEKDVDEEIKKYGKYLNVLYSDKELTFKDIKKQIMAVQNYADLFIVDHLHYIGMEPDKFGENHQMRELVHSLHDLSLHIGVPVIAIAHMRKSGVIKKLVPDMEDFHGSSELFKVSTKVITFAIGRKYDIKSKESLSPTYFRIDKCRLSGNVTRYVGKVNFDLRKNSYEDEYTIGKLNFDETEFNELDREYYPARIKEILKIDEGEKNAKRQIDAKEKNCTLWAMEKNI